MVQSQTVLIEFLINIDKLRSFTCPPLKDAAFLLCFDKINCGGESPGLSFKVTSPGVESVATRTLE